MKFINQKEVDDTLYMREHLYHWWKRRIECSYKRNFLVSMFSSKHCPKREFTLRLYRLSINLRVGNAPWEESKG